ncbi:MAG: alpha-galactosidase [Bifidobacterium adolescentis]
MTTDTGHMISCNKLTHTVIGRELRYSRHQTDVIGHRNELKIVLEDEDRDLEVTVRYSVDDRAPMVQTDVTVTNMGLEPVLLDSVTSWSSTFGLPADAAESAEPDLGDWDLLEGRFDWLAEGRWHRKPVRDLIPAIGQELTEVDPRQSHQVVSTGTWSTGTNVPLAILESEKQQLAWLFQIEHNGAWRWDVQDNTSDGCVALSGPTNENHSWSEELHLGEAFTTVPASFTVAHDFDGVVANVTDYRREVRSPHRDNAEPSVVFNDYMNTIYGDPTTEKELPLIEAAGKTGIGIFVIDCGWYDDTGNWWPSVGEWMPSKTRFPGKKGIVEVIDAIKDAGMIPGIWIEPEVIGVKSPMAEKLPDSAFFQRHGKRVVEQERYLLDLRDPAARKHLDSVIDRLVSEYGIGYFKFDYNVSPGAGTDYDADAPGAGLLGHNRAYSDWIDGLRERYPDVILENCSSGGMREDFAQTSLFPGAVHVRPAGFPPVPGHRRGRADDGAAGAGSQLGLPAVRHGCRGDRVQHQHHVPWSLLPVRLSEPHERIPARMGAGGRGRVQEACAAGDRQVQAVLADGSAWLDGQDACSWPGRRRSRTDYGVEP